MFDILLLSFFSLFIIITTVIIIRKNILFGGVYFFLFIYSIFAQIGYCFFPELSEFVKAYFGKKTFYTFYCFNFLSFFSFFLLFIFIFPSIKKIHKYTIIHEKKIILLVIFLSLISAYYLYLFLFFLTHLSIIDYSNSDPEFLKNQTIFFKTFLICFKFLAPISTILYIQFRIKNVYPNISLLTKRYLFITLFISVFLLFLISNKIGSRTDIVAFLLGVFIFELLNGFSFKKIIVFLSFSFVVLVFLLYIENTRGEGNESLSELSSTQKFILKDYFGPAHMLYAVIGLDYIDPVFVVKSNFANSLILLDVDYLQMPITEKINPGIANRSQGYAFYLFTEGFFFMGFWGFIYNSLMLMSCLSLWHVISSSVNKYYNFIIICILSTQLANLARNQSSYFIKDILVFVTPLIIFIYFSSGLRPMLFKK